MKKHYLALLVFAFPFAASAQITNAENYMVGDQIHTIDCSVPASPGNSGTGQTWNFSSVADSGNSTVWVLDDTSSSDPNDIVMSLDPNVAAGTPVHKTSTQNLSLGFNFGAYSFTYTPGLLLAERSFNYATTTNLSYTVSGTLNGSGNVDFNCDGSGTLTTPAGTYPNVYRVMMVQDETDSIVLITPSYYTQHNVSYVWYDNNHTAPLFRIDSTYTSGTGTLVFLSDTSATAEYLEAIFPASVNSTSASVPTASANITGSEMAINASLQNGQQYFVNVFNMNGQVVYKNAFTASGSVEHFSMNQQLAAGTYFVNIYKKNSGSAPIIIKTIKN